MVDINKIKQIRLNLGDLEKKLFEDEELELILKEEISVNAATARALEILALKQESGLVTSYTRGDVSMSKTTLLEMAQHYRERDANGFSFFNSPGVRGVL